MDAVPRLDTVTLGTVLLTIPTTPEVRPVGRDADTPSGAMCAGRTVPRAFAGLMTPVTLVPVVPVPLTVTAPVGETDTVGSAAMAAFVVAAARASTVNCRFRACSGVPAWILWTHWVTCCCVGAVWRIDSNIAVTCRPAGVSARFAAAA